MRFLLIVLFTTISFCAYSQEGTKISTMDLVKILNDNDAEAMHYYKYNWKVMRERAVKRGYIDSFQLLVKDTNESNDFDIVLITTYKDETQYKLKRKTFRDSNKRIRQA